jgi:signal transduction histidine kinase
VLDETADDTTEASWLKGIIQESRRISEIVKNLLQFSRQDKQSHSYARIEDIIDQTVSLVKALFRKDQIDLSLDVPPDLPSVKCRSQQIQQVLLNLLTNARDTLNEKYPGYHEDKLILLSVTAFDKDDRRWIRMTVEDHGTGMSEQEQLRIFEPFYSTKPKEMGTGLGLSISFGIVRDHHGYFEIDSRKAQYTRIHCILPVDNGWTTPTATED